MRVFLNKPVEIISAFAMILIGAVAAWGATSVPNSQGALPIILSLGAAALSALGGTLFSHTLSSFNASERAAEILRPQLSQANMVLANTTYQIGKIITDFADGELDASTAILFTQRSFDSLRSSITIYEQITGQDVEVDRLKRTLFSLKNMKEVFSEDQNSQELKNIVEDKINELRTELRTQGVTSSSLSTKLTKESIQTDCPVCSAPTYVRIGVSPGESAHGVCRDGHAFIVHRNGRGEVVYGRDDDGSAPDLNEYERILKRQRVPIVNPIQLEHGVRALSSAFSQAENRTFLTRESMEEVIVKLLSARGVDEPIKVAHDMWLIGMRAKIFNLLGERSGIRLRKHFSETELLREVRTSLVERVMNEATDPVDEVMICELLSHDEASRNQVIQAVRYLGPSRG